MNRNILNILTLSAVTFMVTACSSDDDPTPENPKPDVPATTVEASTDVLYEVNPRFYGDNNCLKAVTSDISRIKKMNVNTLWVMPPYETGVEKSVGSPYCVKNYKKIDPKLGTLDDFKHLVKTAHDNGMRVILDWVANHTSFDNPWTVTNPERYRKDANGNIASTAAWKDVAQLDYDSPSTREAMIDAMSYWVTEADVDGFRCDYSDGVPHYFWKEDIEALTKIDADIFMLAETDDTSFYADGFYMVYDWGFPNAVTSLYKSGNAAKFYEYINARNSLVPADKSMLRYAFNHDVAAENNVATMYTNQNGTILAYLLAAFTGETPLLYSSMDVEGLSGTLSFFNNAHRKFTFSEKLTKTYGDINKAYIESAAARGGDMTTYTSKDAVIIAFTNGDKKLLVVTNPANEAKSVKLPITYAALNMTNLITGEAVTVPTAVEMPAFGYHIYAN